MHTHVYTRTHLTESQGSRDTTTVDGAELVAQTDVRHSSGWEKGSGSDFGSVTGLPGGGESGQPPPVQDTRGSVTGPDLVGVDLDLPSSGTRDFVDTRNPLVRRRRVEGGGGVDTCDCVWGYVCVCVRSV